MKPCECAMTVHHGGYSTLSEAYGAVVTWISENGYEIAGAPFDLYIKTQFDSLPPEEWETEVYFPIRRKSVKMTANRPGQYMGLSGNGFSDSPI